MGFQPLETLQLCKQYTQQLTLWNTAFSSFMTHRSYALTSKQLRGAALLKIHHMTAKIMAEITPDITDLRATGQAVNDVAVFAKFTPEFATIVSLSRSLIAGVEQDKAAGKPPLTFSTDLGIIGPLWYICVKCQDTGVREAAVDLLDRCERREGMWDGAASAKMAREFWSIESSHKSILQSQPKTTVLAAMGWHVNGNGDVVSPSSSSSAHSSPDNIDMYTSNAAGFFGASMSGVASKETMNAGTPVTNGFLEAGGGSNGSGVGDWVELVFEDGNRWEWKFRDRYLQTEEKSEVPENVRKLGDFGGLFLGDSEW
jgi:hypothetical protein